MAVIGLSVPRAAHAQLDVDQDPDEVAAPPPRLLSEIMRVLLGWIPRVDGDILVGLNLGASLTEGVAPFGDGETFGLIGLEENVMSGGILSVHLRTNLGIGFGTSRIYGASEQTLDGGVRIPFGSSPLGFYTRAGLDVGAYGDSRYYVSRVSLPYGRAGFQYMGRHTLVEVGAAGGAVLAGRFNVGDDGVGPMSHTTEVGPTVLVTSKLVDLSGEVRRVGPDPSSGHETWLARGMACGTLRGFGVILCSQAAYANGYLVNRPTHATVHASSFFGGLTVGYLVE